MAAPFQEVMPFVHTRKKEHTMIGDAVRAEIELYAARRMQNPLFKLTASGDVTRAMAVRYVANVHFMHSLTPIHLGRAGARARAMGNEPLAACFAAKLGEEEGHEVWSERDLESLAASTVAAAGRSVSPAIHSLCSLLTRSMDDDPAYYLVYIAFSEYITVILGPEWLALLEGRCGIPRTSMTSIDNHIELDREHAEEMFAAIDDFVTDPRKAAPMRAFLGEVLVCFDRFCADVAAGEEAWEAADDDASDTDVVTRPRKLPRAASHGPPPR